MTSVLIRERRDRFDLTHLCKDGGRGWSDVCISHGMPRVVSSH